jgi:hypothetical protein
MLRFKFRARSSILYLIFTLIFKSLTFPSQYSAARRFLSSGIFNRFQTLSIVVVVCQ